MTHICVSKLSIIDSDNGLSPERRLAIIWTNAGILLIGPLGTNFSEILIEILTFSFKKMRLKMSSAKWRPFCLGLNVLSDCSLVTPHYMVTYRSGSTCHWFIAWRVVAPSHLLNQCWFIHVIINMIIKTKVQWHSSSSEGSFTRDTSVINHKN